MNKPSSISQRIKKRVEPLPVQTQIRTFAKKPSLADRIVVQKRGTQKKVIIRKENSQREASKPDLRQDLQKLKSKVDTKKDSKEVQPRAVGPGPQRPHNHPISHHMAPPYMGPGHLPGLYPPPGMYPMPPYGYLPMPHVPQPTFVKLMPPHAQNRDNTKSFVVAVTNIPEHYQDQRQLLGLIPSNVELRGVQLNQGRAQLHFIRRNEALEVESK